MPVNFSIPLGLCWTLLVILITGIVLIAFKKQLWVTVLQMAAILLMGVVLLGVQRFQIKTLASTQQNYVALIDTSQSMAQNDGMPTSRWEQLNQYWLNVQLRNQMQTIGNWQFRSFDQQLKTVSRIETLKPIGQHSNLLGSLIDLSNELPSILNPKNSAFPWAEVPIVLFSDGNQSLPINLSTTISLLKKQKIKVHAVGLGKSASQTKPRGYAWAEPSICQPGQKVQLHVWFQGLSTITKQDALEIILNQSNQKKIVLKHQLDGLDSAHLTHNVKLNTLGIHSFNFHVTQPEKNIELKMPAIVQCVDDPVNVLILEAKPHWFTRNIQRALILDPNLHVTSRYALGDHREIELSNSSQFVVHDEFFLKDQDVILLGHRVYTMLSLAQQEALEQWVTQGGGLFWFRGSNIESAYWPEALIPANDEQMPPRLWKKLVPEALTPSEFLQHRKLGQGNIIRLNHELFDVSATGDKQLNLLAIRIAHYLAKPLNTASNLYAQLQLDRYAATANEPVKIKVIVRNNMKPELDVSMEDQLPIGVVLQQDSINSLIWKTTFVPKKEGVYRINLRSHSLEQAITVRPVDDESMHLGTNHALLKKIALQTGGEFWTESKQMFNALIKEQQLKRSKEKQALTEPYFNHPVLVIMIVCLWLGSWYLAQRQEAYE